MDEDDSMPDLEVWDPGEEMHANLIGAIDGVIGVIDGVQIHIMRPPDVANTKVARELLGGAQRDEHEPRRGRHEEQEPVEGGSDKRRKRGGGRKARCRESWEGGGRSVQRGARCAMWRIRVTTCRCNIDIFASRSRHETVSPNLGREITFSARVAYVTRSMDLRLSPAPPVDSLMDSPTDEGHGPAGQKI
ncbi:hypothetical protein THAOC_19078 [Thalassiosira oceanica]|uniref:Uncharacterized protein n=1 Tax=Thalassiosira oceanica TaxID=159749 RepID=K0S6K1_THAOC|nr:hypothetical protein THAOC_19078 [Thalassiosira oceanica]|eukprot:EJK60544.1 hypothetical protein THAOC_19078 [Thalassiosira oceanica]